MIDEGKLTAWERWELADFGEPALGRAGKQAPDTAPEPEPAPTVPMPTAEEVEQILQRARKEGYDAGYKEGQAKARDEAVRLARAAAKLEAAMSGFDTAVADELLRLGVELARQVVRHEIKAHPQGLLDVVREALLQMPQQHAAIHLHPDDAALLRALAGEQLTPAGHRINENPRLARGDCLLEAGGSHLDGTVATRWRRVLEGLGLEDAWNPPPESTGSSES